MDGISLQESNLGSEYLLGCEIQQNMKWNIQYSVLKKKLKKRLAGVYMLRNVVPYTTLKQICEGWFSSVLVYCLPLFGGGSKDDIGDLQVIQNQVVRLITKSSRLENRETMFDQVGWLTVYQLIRYHTILTIYRIRKSGEPENLFKYLCLDNRNGNIIIPQSSLTLYRNSFIYRGIIDWNNIPKPTRSLEKIGHFKKALKMFIFMNTNKFQ